MQFFSESVSLRLRLGELAVDLSRDTSHRSLRDSTNRELMFGEVSDLVERHMHVLMHGRLRGLRTDAHLHADGSLFHMLRSDGP